MNELKKSIVGLFSYSILDRILSGFLHLIIFTVIIRHLVTEDVGILGLFGGILVFFNILNISPGAILIRDFKKIENDIDKHLGDYIIFGIYKIIVFLILSMIISLFFYYKIGPKIFILPIFTLFFSFQSLSSIPQEGLYVTFRQREFFFINLIFSFIQLIYFILLMPFFKTLLFYVISLLIFNVLLFFILLLTFTKLQKTSISFRFELKRFFKDNLMDFSLWNHLGGAITYMIYRIDTFILSFFVDIEKIAVYTVALTVSNYFFIIPMIGEKVLKVGYSRLEEGSKEESKFFKIGTISLNVISIGQFLLYLIVGKWFITFLFPKFTEISTVYELTALIVMGVTILNLARPISAILIIRKKLSKLFFAVFLPAGVFALAVYFVFAAWRGIYGVAFGNIVSYLFFAILIFSYSFKYNAK